MNPCHKVVRSIRNATLKLCADCAKQAVYQKRTELWKNHSRIANRMLVRKFLAKNKIVIMHQLPYSPDLVSDNFFLFPELKTPMKGKRSATIWEIQEKSKQERFRSVLRIGKNSGISVLYLRRLL